MGQSCPVMESGQPRWKEVVLIVIVVLITLAILFFA